jgi:cytochrome P450
MSDPVEPPLFPFALSASAEEDPVAMALLDDAPVVRACTVDGTEVWVVLSHETARQAVNDTRLSRSAAFEPGAPRITPAQSGPDMLTSMDGAEHTRVRRFIAKAFTPRVMERMRPRIEGLVNELLDEISEQDRPVDLVKQLATPLPVTVICQLFGVPEDNWSRFCSWADRIQATTAFTV